MLTMNKHLIISLGIFVEYMIENESKDTSQIVETKICEQMISM